MGASGSASLGSAYAVANAMTFFAPAVAPASTVAAMYWDAGPSAWQNWEPRADAHEWPREWSDADYSGYGVADDGAHDDQRDDAHGTATRPRSAASGAGGATKASRRARHGLTTTLLRATAEAAEALGRAPEEVWAEALNVWLANRETLSEDTIDDAGQPQRASSGHARPIEVRRQEVWSEIDETLSALRAS